MGSSCRMGTKKTHFLDSMVAIFFKFADNASLDASAITNGRLLRRCALAAIVTAVSVMPFAIFAKVLPVQGAITIRSGCNFGPMGSAPCIVVMGGVPVMASRVAR